MQWLWVVIDIRLAVRGILQLTIVNEILNLVPQSGALISYMSLLLVECAKLGLIHLVISRNGGNFSQWP